MIDEEVRAKGGVLLKSQTVFFSVESKYAMTGTPYQYFSIIPFYNRSNMGIQWFSVFKNNGYSMEWIVILVVHLYARQCPYEETSPAIFESLAYIIAH